jgi:uncharacterized protein YciI
MYLAAMQWLMILRMTRPEMLTEGPTADEMSHIQAHFAYWKQLTEEGTAFLVGRTQTNDPETIGLAIFQAQDEDAAQAIAKADPAVVNGVFAMELRPYGVALLGNPEPFRPHS